MILNFAHHLTNENIKACCVSPGFLLTRLGKLSADFMKKTGAKNPNVGGVLIKDVIEGLKGEHMGKVVHSSGHFQDW